MTAICPIHNIELQEKEGQYGPYFSHTIKDVGFCDGKKIKPFKTVAPFQQPAAPTPVPGIPPTIVREPVIEPVVAKVDWDAKDRQSIAQTAMKSASEIIAAQINAGILVGDPMVEVKHMANELYRELTNMKSTVTEQDG